MAMSNTKITEDLHIDPADEGYVTIGQIDGISLSELERKMAEHRVFAFPYGCEVDQTHVMGGQVKMTVISTEVKGYLLDEDGYEASSSDTDAFFMDILKPGSSMMMEGSYPDGTGGAIVTKSRVANLDGKILMNIDRSRCCYDGSHVEIQTISDLSDEEFRIQAALSGNVVSLSAFRGSKYM
jgi:hypothetical protein